MQKITEGAVVSFTMPGVSSSATAIEAPDAKGWFKATDADGDPWFMNVAHVTDVQPAPAARPNPTRTEREIIMNFASMTPVFKEMHPTCEMSEEGHTLEGGQGTNRKGEWVQVMCKRCGIEENWQGDERPQSARNVAMEYPALTGDVVTQAHGDYCRANGHAIHTIKLTADAEPVVQPHCPRCGGIAHPEELPPVAQPTGEKKKRFSVREGEARAERLAARFDKHFDGTSIEVGIAFKTPELMTIWATWNGKQVYNATAQPFDDANATFRAHRLGIYEARAEARRRKARDAAEYGTARAPRN